MNQDIIPRTEVAADLRRAEMESVASWQAVPRPIERRESPRIAAEMRVRLDRSREDGSIGGRTCDLGNGGLCVETDAVLTPVELNGVELTLERGRM